MTVHPLAPGWLTPPADGNALAPSVWPASAGRGESGALHLAGVAATALHAAYGTPLYVVDEQEAQDTLDLVNTMTELVEEDQLATNPAEAY